MSATWYAAGFEVTVDNPGHGTAHITATSENGYGSTGEWQKALAGHEVGDFLAAVTARALGTDSERTRRILPSLMTAARAGQLLPALQAAVVLAAAGTDRAERIYPDDGAPPTEPLCIHCNEGSPYHQVVIISEHCAEYGHRAFGKHDADWDREQERYARDRRWWDTAARTRTP